MFPQVIKGCILKRGRFQKTSIVKNDIDSAKRFANLGPATPDMLVRMKKNYLYSEDLSKLQDEIHSFAEEYKSDFEKYVAAGRTMHNPFPSVIVIKGCILKRGRFQKTSIVKNDIDSSKLFHYLSISLPD